MRYAVINSETNIVENIIAWDGLTEWTPPEGCYTQILEDTAAGIGWSFVNGQWIEPTPSE
jgi:hypothetical protein